MVAVEYCVKLAHETITYEEHPIFQVHLHKCPVTLRFERTIIFIFAFIIRILYRAATFILCIIPGLLLAQQFIHALYNLGLLECIYFRILANIDSLRLVTSVIGLGHAI